jgi:tetratricopeptide (TPR) repeat protein
VSVPPRPRSKLQFEVRLAEAERSTTDPDVASLISKGWAANFAAGTSGAESLKLMGGYFTQALERDPQNVSAQIGLGAFHVNACIQMLDGDPASHLTKAEELLRQAIGRKPDAGNAHYYLSLVHRVRGNMDAALESLERAIAINPSHASSHAQMGMVLTLMGRGAEGLEHVHYSMRLSPRDPIMSYWLSYAGRAELELGHDDRAVEYYRRALALNPRHSGSLAGLAAAQALSGHLDEARAAAATLQNVVPHVPPDRLLRRFGDKASHAPRLHKGLLLALTSS